MKLNKIILLLMLCFSVSIFAQDDDVDDDFEDEMEEEIESTGIFEDAEDALDVLLSENPDLQQHLEAAVGYAIFPNVGKGALIVGVASGNGVVYQNGRVIGTADLKKVDIGLQAGGKAFSELLVFKTDEAFNRFKNDEFEFSAGASAVVLKSGKSFNAKYNDGVAVFAHPKAGLMAEAAVGGQRFEFHPKN